MRESDPRCQDCISRDFECNEGYRFARCECPTCGYRYTALEARCNDEPRLCPRCVGEVELVEIEDQESER